MVSSFFQEGHYVSEKVETLTGSTQKLQVDPDDFILEIGSYRIYPSRAEVGEEGQVFPRQRQRVNPLECSHSRA